MNYVFFQIPLPLLKPRLKPRSFFLQMLKKKIIPWEDARKILKSHDFINRVISFDCKSVNAATRRRIQAKFSSNEWDIERIFKASTAAGPLAKWVESSISYVAIAECVEPLQREIQTLQVDIEANQVELEKQMRLILQLEETLHELKTEYAQLISQVENIKREMDTVKEKVQRSRTLLENLGSEKERWAATAESLETAHCTAIGDCLIAAAFCTYIGFFEHAERRTLLEIWRSIVFKKGIRFREDISLVEFLSHPSERLQWTSHALPSDDLSLENAIILKHYHRFPLVVDPSGQATQFLMAYYASKKLTKTSFLDAAFLKNLESALRFGTTLLVQDVERVDPILNSVLNQETQKQGGRVLITLGDAEIDFSPSFSMFLTTRDPTMQFTPDLCSRFTFVNFTITPSSLQNQCLNMILKSERPDVDSKRNDILKLQGEFRVKIRELEDALLLALSNVQGNILDNDTVIGTLENLKKQAAEVAKEAAGADKLMKEIDAVSNSYLPLATAATRIYFSLQHLQTLHFLYQYDMKFFMGILYTVLSETPAILMVDPSPPALRLEALLQHLLSESYQRVARGLMHEDQLVFALQLLHIRIEMDIAGPFEENEFTFLLKGYLQRSSSETAKQSKTSSVIVLEDEPLPSAMETGHARILSTFLNAEQRHAISLLQQLPCFSSHLHTHLVEKAAYWQNEFLPHAEPETILPEGDFMALPSPSTPSPCVGALRLPYTALLQHLRVALLIRALRPDRLPAVLSHLIHSTLGREFLSIAELTPSVWRTFVQKQSTAASPIVLVASPGFDPSGRVMQLASDMRISCTAVAMGSQEGYLMAERSIQQAIRQGTWVLFKNVHLSTAWLHELEKLLHRSALPEGFRIFLTMEIHPKIPRNLLRLSSTLLFEPPVGLKASLRRSYASLLFADVSEKPPIMARCRLHFLLAFLHAVILERKRYTPIGWSKFYEFSDADQRCALTIIDTWLDRTLYRRGMPTEGGGSDTIDPHKIPWEALQTLLADVCYGGRLDNAVDQRLLHSFVKQFFTHEAFEDAYYLSMMDGTEATDSRLMAPELGRSRQMYVNWIEQLQDVDNPSWLGFTNRAERLILGRSGLSSITKWCSLYFNSKEELQELMALDNVSKAVILTDAAPAMRSLSSTLSTHPTKQLTHQGSICASTWLTELLPQIQENLSLLPSAVVEVPVMDSLLHDPMYRYLQRELATGRRLLEIVRLDLHQLKEVCRGNIKFTNHLRDLAHYTSSSTVPDYWKSFYSVLNELTMASWILDFSHRLKQLNLIASDILEPSAGVSTPAQGSSTVEWQQAKTVWLGGCFFPSAYLTATSQIVAQKYQWSLDDLDMQMDVNFDPSLPDVHASTPFFILKGLTMEGAQWNSTLQCFDIADERTLALPPTRIRWIQRETTPSALTRINDILFISVPVFLNCSRKDLISFVTLPFIGKFPPSLWYQRGVALLLWSSL